MKVLFLFQCDLTNLLVDHNKINDVNDDLNAFHVCSGFDK